MALPKVRAEIRFVRRWLRAEELPLIWPFATGYIPTAGRRFRGAAEARSPVPEVGGDAFDPERSSREQLVADVLHDPADHNM
jgi:hypothetical protein